MGIWVDDHMTVQSISGQCSSLGHVARIVLFSTPFFSRKIFRDTGDVQQRLSVAKLDLTDHSLHVF